MNDAGDQRRRIQVRRVAGDLDETVLAPFGFAIIHGFGDPVGVGNQSVPGRQVDLGCREYNDVGSAYDERGIVTRVDKAEPLRRWIVLRKEQCDETVDG